MQAVLIIAGSAGASGLVFIVTGFAVGTWGADRAVVQSQMRSGTVSLF